MASTTTNSTSIRHRSFSMRCVCPLCTSNAYNCAPSHWRRYPLETYHLKCDPLPYTCKGCRQCYHRECIGKQFDESEELAANAAEEAQHRSGTPHRRKKRDQRKTFTCTNCFSVVVSSTQFRLDMKKELQALAKMRKAELEAEPNHILFKGWASRYLTAKKVKCHVDGQSCLTPIT